jgi:hypothetical protein
MRVKITGREAGSIPSETVVTISTSRGSGSEEVVVHASQVDDDGVEAGFIGRQGDEVLVELPRETVSGKWRVWVPKDEVS